MRKFLSLFSLFKMHIGLLIRCPAHIPAHVGHVQRHSMGKRIFLKNAGCLWITLDPKLGRRIKDDLIHLVSQHIPDIRRQILFVCRCHGIPALRRIPFAAGLCRIGICLMFVGNTRIEIIDL